MEHISKNLDSFDKFREKIDKEMKYHTKRKEELWNLIKDDKCKYCYNGDIRYEEDGFIYSWECTEYFKMRDCQRRRGFIKSVFGDRFMDIDIKDFKEDIQKNVNTYQFDKNFLIIGAIGTGKTALLTCLVIKAKQEKRKIIVKNPVSITRFIFDNDFKMIENLKTADILGIDDLGIETTTNVFNATFTDIIDYRWRYKLPTIITTNLDLAQMADNYPRAFDRLTQEAIYVTLEGKSKRKKENENNK